MQYIEYSLKEYEKATDNIERKPHSFDEYVIVLKEAYQYKAIG